MHYIYKITNQLNGKVYVGQTIDDKKRWKAHKAYAKQDEPVQYIHRAMKKYGIENFLYEVIDFAANRWQADCLETNYIQQYDTRNKDKGYNVAHGGNVTWQSGLPPEAYPMYGKHHTDESKRKISEGNLGKIMPPHTDEWKQAMSKRLKGVARPKEWVNKIVESRAGYSHTDETRSKISETMTGLMAGENHPRALLTWEIVRAMRQDYKDGIKQCDISKKYNVRKETVYQVVKYKNWIE